ncbi:BglG family transcription antiterminator [Salinicoccus carnicancri]|uniref:BglG family transcription antiterminator n=1 Tax=Salinicoccus carnicancri TaxID=558170 RepID=UPI0003103FD3|nr:BglG family transcription antiterminator [Salinicoccus carnicancri]
MLTPRQKRIIKYLTQQEDFTSVRFLAEMFNVSDRTIQYDLEHIEDALQRPEVRITRNKGKGVIVKADDELLGIVSDVTEEHLKYYSAEERFEQILLMLFESLNPISSGKLSTDLNVTRRTIVDDLKSIHQWLKRRKLELNYVRNKGFNIKGDEQKFRESYVEILIQHYRHIETLPHLKYVGKNSLPKIYEAIENGLNKANYSLMQSSIDGLVFHIAISLHRLRNDYEIVMPREEFEKLSEKKEFEIAAILQQEIEQTFNLRLPVSETGYIALHLLGARQSFNEKTVEFEEDDVLKSTIIYFLRNITQQIGVTIDKDKELIQGLLVHLRPAIYRMKYGFRNDNPLLGEINDRYPDIIYAIEANIHLLEDTFEVTFSNDEVAFIAIHVGSSIERKNMSRNTDLNIVLICGSGIGTSQLLKTRIESYYPELNIIEVLSLSKLEPSYFERHDLDLIISTIQMEEQPVKMINVSPFLDSNDRSKLNSAINSHRETVVQKTMELGPVLNQLMHAEHIRWNVSADTWKKAISKTVEPLIEDSIVQPEYADEIIRQFNIHGPYMVIGSQIALIHASSFNYVNQTGYSFVSLDEPVRFGHEDYDPVRYIICLATTSPKIHLNALRQLSFILMDKVRMERVKNHGKPGLIENINEVSKL